ncbi:MAG: glycosyl-4,4'-diaponeurosporenoate acyltransferase CrtO family protein [Verrucomicrobiales bacterium]
MSPIELPDILIVILNVVTIPLIHLGVSWLFVQMPGHWFRPDAFLFREKPGENGGLIYESLFAIRSWKNAMPDGAAWFNGGFSKKKFTSSDPNYIREFIIETCRGEMAHLAQFAVLTLLLLWNPWPANIVIIVYALLSNFPCTILQRHTRFRMTALLNKVEPHDPIGNVR